MSSSKLAESICYDPEKNSLSILNQLLLPNEVLYENIDGIEDAWKAIRLMKVRGAPAIAIVGLLGLSVELFKPNIIESFDKDLDKLISWVKEKADYLCTSRPTAVNIRKEFDKLLSLLIDSSKINNFDSLIDLIKTFCNDSLKLDRQINKNIGENGCQSIIKRSDSGAGSDKKFNILTHCNTGSLATAGYGTALGVIRSLHARGRLERAYCTETRPYNQGARLTAWELVTENIPSTLICDNMVASLMNSRKIDAVVVGADRVVANGDTANKIGTYQIAILAKHFNVPFYVASPKSTIDMKISDGSKIPIEERPDHEMKWIGGKIRIAPLDIDCWNPAFDITPSELITGGIITESEVIESDKLSKLSF